MAETIASGLPPGAVLALHGPLGSGKTTFAKGVASALGVTEVITSPSFSLVHEYTDGRLPLYHVDLYRVQGTEEAELLDLAAYIYGSGITVIEWAERATELLPAHTRHIRFVIREDLTREILELEQEEAASESGSSAPADAGPSGELP